MVSEKKTTQEGNAAIMYRYEGCRWEFAHRLTGDGHARLMGTNYSVHSVIWDEEDDEFIRAHYPGCSIRFLRQQLGYGHETILKHLVQLGLRQKEQMLKDNKSGRINQEIIKCYEKEGPEKMSKRLGLSYSAIYHRAAALGLKANKNLSSLHQRWKPGYDEELTRCYGKELSQNIARRLNISESAVLYHAKKLGLTKPTICVVPVGAVAIVAAL